MPTDLDPIARGTLEATPFAHLLLSIKSKALDGTLALSSEDRSQNAQDRILFRNGEPVAARFNAPAASLERGMLGLVQRHRGDYAFYEQDLIQGRPDAVEGR